MVHRFLSLDIISVHGVRRKINVRLEGINWDSKWYVSASRKGLVLHRITEHSSCTQKEHLQWMEERSSAVDTNSRSPAGCRCQSWDPPPLGNTPSFQGSPKAHAEVAFLLCPVFSSPFYGKHRSPPSACLPHSWPTASIRKGRRRCWSSQGWLPGNLEDTSVEFQRGNGKLCQILRLQRGVGRQAGQGNNQGKHRRQLGDLAHRDRRLPLLLLLVIQTCTGRSLKWSGRERWSALTEPTLTRLTFILKLDQNTCSLSSITKCTKNQY